MIARFGRWFALAAVCTSIPSAGQSVATIWGDQVFPGESLTDVTGVAVGGRSSYALRSDGTVVGWGGRRTAPDGLSGVVAIAASDGHFLALKNDGTVVAWGAAAYGVLDVPAGLSGVTAIAAGWYHNLALKSDGTVTAWGQQQPESGHGQVPATVPAGLSGVIAISTIVHNLALKSDGTVVAWGHNDYGQATVPAGLSGVTAVAAGGDFSLALKGDGTIVAWGDNSYGQTDVPAGLTGVVRIAAGDLYGVALKNNGTVVAWGLFARGNAPRYSSIPSYVPAGLSGVVNITAGIWGDVLAIKGDGTIVGWGCNMSGQSVVPGSLTNVAALSLGGDKLALRTDGTLVPWGILGRRGGIPMPANLSGVTAISTSPLYAADSLGALALKADGTVVAWGDNEYGQSAVPAGLPPIQAVAAGGKHSLALTRSGTVIAWGDNRHGETDVPAGLSGVVSIGAGYYYSLALRNDGRVVAWGDRFQHGSPTGTAVPSGLSGVVAIAAGTFHALALKRDGTVVAWGDQATVPAGLSDVIGISAGTWGDLALKSDGTVVSWGEIADGEIVPLRDDGTPKAVHQNDLCLPPPGLTSITAIASSRCGGGAIKAVNMPTTVMVTTSPAPPARSPVTFTVTVNPARGLLRPSGALVRASVSGLPDRIVTLKNGVGTFTVSEGFAPGAAAISVSFHDPSGTFANSSGSVTVAVRRADQSIDFDAIPDRGRGDPSPALSARASSGLPVRFQIVSGPGTLQGSVVTVTGPGRIVVRASQEGNQDYAPAPDIERSFLGDATRLRVATSPAGLLILVDGGVQPTPAALLYAAGTTHTLAPAVGQVSLSGVRYAFAAWADGGPAQRTVTVAQEDANYTAQYSEQYMLQTEVRPTGAGTLALTPAPVDGYYNAGVVVQIEARPAAGRRFVKYTGTLNSTRAVQQVTMSQRHSVIAYFADSPGLDAVTDAAGFQAGPLAPGGLFALFGGGLGSAAHAATQPLPVSLGSSSLSIRPSQGAEAPALLLDVLDSQINFQVPEGVALGPAVLTLTDSAGRKATLETRVEAVSPGIFTVNSSGSGAPAGSAIRVTAGGEQVETRLTSPIDLGADGDEVYLVLYGTGLRHRSSLNAATVSAGGLPLETLSAGAQGNYAGLDQVNAKLSRALAGRGEIDLVVTVDGRASNTVRITVR